ncbi:MAG: beta-propeller domain-containing protein, partial [Jatrophihabitantaceae bacterium]
PGQQYAYALSTVERAGSARTAAVPAATGADTSTTNVQEPGVDEPDIVKTDGSRVVTITDGVLRVIDDATRAVSGSLDLTMYQGWQNAQLLVDGDHALVILGGSGGYVASVMPAYPRPVGGARTQSSTYLYVDLTGRPKVTGTLQASGAYVDARMVGSTVRLVADSAPILNFPPPTASTASSPAKSKAANQAIIRKAALSAWQPTYTVTTESGTTTNTVPCDQISHPAKYTGASMLTIYTLDLTRLGADPQPATVAADGDTVYASADSLYIASNPDWNGSAATQQTEIHRFDISRTTRPTYLGSGSVPGRLLSQYSLSDYVGHLRIATTTGGFGPAQSSSVYILDSATLKITGHVDGLGKGEQLYAVRFIGPLAYVVTFRQTDPLYVVDLHDPAAPKVVGTLKLTGYSDYLHDAGDGRLLGVGQDASAAGRVAGLQVSLFDVTTPATPTRTAQVVRKDAPGEGTLDPHAFLYWQPTGLVVVPVQSWTPAESGMVLVLRVNGTTLTSLGLLANPLASGAIDDGQGIQRSLVVDGALWTVSGSGVQVSDQATLKRQAWVPFP